MSILKKAEPNEIYTIKVELLNDTDKKETIDLIYFFAKIMNFGLLMPTIIIFGFIYNWKIDATVFQILVLLILIGNGTCIVWYLVTKSKFRNSNKIVITSTITNVQNLNDSGENHRGTVIYFGLEEINISNCYAGDEIKIGDTVALHYFQKANKEKGSLIRVEKI